MSHDAQAAAGQRNGMNGNIPPTSAAICGFTDC
jgi:hypothetical protein